MIRIKTAKIKERELIVQLYGKKKTCREIASILGVSKSKASYWINRFKNDGSLKDRKRSGRPTPLTKSNLKEIFLDLKNVIESNTHKAGIMSKEALRVIEKKTGRQYTMRHALRIMHKIGFSLVTPRPKHIKKDKNAADKFKKDFKKNSRQNIWVIPS